MTLDQFVPGVKVHAIMKATTGEPPRKAYGVVGNGWTAEGTQLLVKFDGGWVYVNERNAGQFFLEPTN